jgi:hypothetical protein
LTLTTCTSWILKRKVQFAGLTLYAQPTRPR